MERPAEVNDLLSELPGEEYIREGLRDWSCQRTSIPFCLVAIAQPLLSRAGLLFPHSIEMETSEMELVLYRLLCKEGGDAYSRYNALLRLLTSFERALRLRLRKRAASS